MKRTRILYLDCSLSGISGDMTFAALIDLGADVQEISKQLKTFDMEPFTIEVKEVIKKGFLVKKLRF